MVDYGPTAAGPMLGIRFRQEVSVDNKATCTSFGDEKIFKAGGYRWFLLCAFEEYLYGLKRRTAVARSGSENLALTTLNMNCLRCPWPNHKPWGEGGKLRLAGRERRLWRIVKAYVKRYEKNWWLWKCTDQSWRWAFYMLFVPDIAKWLMPLIFQFLYVVSVQS